MTDHANELRRYSRKIGHPAGDVPSVMLAAADEIERLAARLEATEEDRARFLVEMGRLCAQCDALRLRIKAAEKERDALRAKIEQMEQQVPSHWGCTVLQSDGRWKEEVSREAPPEGYFSIRDIFPLYALPGAQPAPSVPDGVIDRIEAAEKERDNANAAAASVALQAIELESKLEVAEKTNRGWLRANATGGWIDNLRIENDTLRAKIDQLEEDTKAVILAANSGAHPKLDEASLWQTIANGMITPAHIAQPAPSAPDGWREGVESAARLIDMKADLYSTRFGHDDMGVLSFGTGTHAEIKMAHYTGLLDLADEVRATLAAAPEFKL